MMPHLTGVLERIAGLAAPRPLLALLLTIGIHDLAARLHRRIRLPITNPLLLTVVVLAAGLLATGTSYDTYMAGTFPLSLLLGPATVALALPLVRSIGPMRRSIGALGPALLAGAVVGALVGPLLVRLTGGDAGLGLAMAAKSATTPIAIAIAAEIGGPPSLSASLAIASGILVAALLRPLARWLRLDDPRAVGLAAGIAGSGIGAAETVRRDETAGAFAAVAVGLNGLLTALIVPALVHFWPF